MIAKPSNSDWLNIFCFTSSSYQCAFEYQVEITKLMSHSIYLNRTLTFTIGEQEATNKIYFIWLTKGVSGEMPEYRITITCLCNIRVSTAIIHSYKNGNFQKKNCGIVLILAQNMYRGYTLELLH